MSDDLYGELGTFSVPGGSETRKLLSEITPEQQLATDKKMLQEALTASDSRIKELEAENARHIAVNSLLSGDEPEVKLANRVYELEAEVTELHKVVQYLNSKITVQSSAQSPEQNYICVSCKLVTNHKQKRCIQCGCQTHEPTAAAVTYPADTRHERLKSPSLVNELSGTIAMLLHHLPNTPDFDHIRDKAKAAIAKASKEEL